MHQLVCRRRVVVEFLAEKEDDIDTVEPTTSLKSLPDFTQLRHSRRVAEPPHQFVFFALFNILLELPVLRSFSRAIIIFVSQRRGMDRQLSDSLELQELLLFLLGLVILLPSASRLAGRVPLR